MLVNVLLSVWFFFIDLRSDYALISKTAKQCYPYSVIFNKVSNYFPTQIKMWIELTIICVTFVFFILIFLIFFLCGLWCWWFLSLLGNWSSCFCGKKIHKLTCQNEQCMSLYRIHCKLSQKLNIPVFLLQLLFFLYQFALIKGKHCK